MSLTISAKEMAAYIDHTILKTEASAADVARICDEALEYGFKAVCVNSGYAPFVAERLKGSAVAVCSVVGFPLGAMHTKAKAYEAEQAVLDGAGEIDMVLNLGMLKSGRRQDVKDDIEAVKKAIGQKIHLKVIIETCLLNHDEKILACKLAGEAGADYVKTSTGFSTGGATVEDIALMRKTVGGSMGVKASGGIKNAADAMAMIEAGASRIGASAGVGIIKELA